MYVIILFYLNLFDTTYLISVEILTFCSESYCVSQKSPFKTHRFREMLPAVPSPWSEKIEFTSAYELIKLDSLHGFLLQCFL